MKSDRSTSNKVCFVKPASETALDFRNVLVITSVPNIVRRKAQYGIGRERAGEFAGGKDSGVQSFGALVVRNQNDAGRVGGANEKRKVQRARREGEA